MSYTYKEPEIEPKEGWGRPRTNLGIKIAPSLFACLLLPFLSVQVVKIQALIHGIASQLGYLSALGPWANYLTLLCLSSLTHKMGRAMESLWRLKLCCLSCDVVHVFFSVPISCCMRAGSWLRNPQLKVKKKKDLIKILQLWFQLSWWWRGKFSHFRGKCLVWWSRCWLGSIGIYVSYIRVPGFKSWLWS